ncbi:MAG: helical backbone metal receptor [bacterium]
MGRLLAILGFAAAVAACSTPAAPPPEGRTLVDDLGRQVAVPAHPARVLSLAPSNTEWMFALGAADRLVGRTDACDAPPEAARVPSVGGLFPPDLERILVARPDLVLMIDGHADLRQTLEARGIPVLVLQPATVDAALADVRLLGRALGREAAADALVRQIQAELAAIPPAAPARRVFYEVWHDPVTGAGPATFVGDLLRRAGGVNVLDAAAGPWPVVPLETLVRARPDVIIAGSSASAAAILGGERPGLSATPAAQAGRVHAIPDPAWLARPGPRLGRGLAWLAETLRRP